MKKILFISDLHLQASQPQATHAFLGLLKDHQDVEALYILGDFFEAWIGDDDKNDYHQSIIDAMKAATKSGLNIYFLHGNRDFLIGKKFLQETGARFLPDETVVNLYGTPTLLMHGDTLCTLDYAYLRSRKFMRNPLVQKIFLCLPIAWRRKIADKMRADSNKHIKMLTDEMMDVTQEAVENKMREHHVQVLIHGHTHRPDMHRFVLENKPATRIVLAAWHDRGSVLVWDEAGNYSFITL